MAAAILQLRALGPLAFHAGGVELRSPSRKALWLAAHVLIGGSARSRAELAQLFWGAASGSKGLGSLRVALTKLPSPILDCLDVGREAIGIATEAKIESDVAAFLAACGASDARSRERAVQLYRGELLEGIDGDEAPEFHDWVIGERHRLRQRAHDAYVAHAKELRSRGNGDAAKLLANAWLARDPADEAMHRLLMEWLAEDAGNDRALAQFDTYRHALAVGAGAAPSPAMTELADRLRSRGTAAPAPRIVAGTALLGREPDLQQLRTTLADPACRLLTLHGMGGVGKTRLALALAESVANAFDDGVFVAALDEVAMPELFAQTVARACGLQPAGAALPLDLLIAFFRRRNALLVLDNLEHLLEAGGAVPVADQVGRLLGGTGARLKVVTTSREPLRLQEEWLHEVEGLPYPGSDEAGDLGAYAAVTLFTQRARQAHAPFSVAAVSADVARICAFVEGLPLGLELAASWMGTVSAAEVAHGLEAQAAALESRHRNRAGRHRSLGAMVAYSWDRLGEEQRQVLSALGALAGAFSTEAAGMIASAHSATLQSLAEKSLVMHAGHGRWRLHEVVRQFAWEQCERSSARRDTVVRRRDAYYLDGLRLAAMRLDGPEEPAVIAEIELESANIREAWRSAARAGNVGALGTAASAWFDYLECRSFNAEGVAAAQAWHDAARGAKDSASLAQAGYYLGIFQRFHARTAEALATLDAALADAPDAAPIKARLHAAKAFTLLLKGELAEAEGEARVALARAEHLRQPSVHASACRVLGLAVLQAGRREEGREWQQRALTLAKSSGRPTLLAAAHNNLAVAENHLGNHAAAEAGYQSALECWREMHATANIGRAMHNLGVVAMRRGDHALALERYREALEMLRKAGDRNLIALNLMSTGDALVRLGRPAEAREPARQALDMAERDGHLLPALDARIVLAQAAIELGDHADAARHLLAGLDGAAEHHYVNVLADAIVSSAKLALAVRPALRAQAVRWAQDIAASNEAPDAFRKDARAFLATLSEPDVPSDPPRGVAALAAEVRTMLVEVAGD